jgi:hypothetical protein
MISRLSSKITAPTDESGMSLSSPCCLNGVFCFTKTLAAYNQFFNIQFHQMLKIDIQLLFGKSREKFGLCAAVNLTNTLDQFPFAHSDILLNFQVAPQFFHIVSHNFISLIHQQPVKQTPYNKSHYIKGPAPLSPQHIDKPQRQSATIISMSNKIDLAESRFERKKLTIFLFSISTILFVIALPRFLSGCCAEHI